MGTNFETGTSQIQLGELDMQCKGNAYERRNESKPTRTAACRKKGRNNIQQQKKDVVHAIDKVASSCVTALHTVVHAIHATTRVAYSAHWSPTSATVHTRTFFFFCEAPLLRRPLPKNCFGDKQLILVPDDFSRHGIDIAGNIHLRGRSPRWSSG